VVVILENHSYTQIIGNSSAPYLNSLRQLGASFTDSHAVSHPSQPNYLATPRTRARSPGSGNSSPLRAD